MDVKPMSAREKRALKDIKNWPPGMSYVWYQTTMRQLARRGLVVENGRVGKNLSHRLTEAGKAYVV
jgi:hypothetical protein